MAKMGEKSCVSELLPQFFTNESGHMKFGTDVCLGVSESMQDTFFDSGRKCVAMVHGIVMAKMGGISIASVANYFGNSYFLHQFS